ncbi:MAG: hypothetical protein PHV99_02660 [Candidatus Pacebacteria bacterium]|nr:hypothetical protein [Candidatus Paceibacterota bacterium]
MKKDHSRDIFLEQLRKIPIVQIACEKTALSRNSVYRWRKEDSAFAKAMDEALAEGEAIINDMSESQLLSKIKNGEWPPIAFWLRKRHPKFKDRLEIVGSLQGPQEELSPEQEATVKEALRLATFVVDLTPKSPPEKLPDVSPIETLPIIPLDVDDNIANEQKHEQPQQQPAQRRSAARARRPDVP